MTNKTFFNFEYDKVSAIMLRHISPLIQDIEFIAAEIMQEHGEKYLSDEDRYENQERYNEAKTEAMRQIIGWLYDCTPPMPEPEADYMLTGDELTFEDAEDHFADIADSTWEQEARAQFDRFKSL